MRPQEYKFTDIYNIIDIVLARSQVSKDFSCTKLR